MSPLPLCPRTIWLKDRQSSTGPVGWQNELVNCAAGIFEAPLARDPQFAWVGCASLDKQPVSSSVNQERLAAGQICADELVNRPASDPIIGSKASLCTLRVHETPGGNRRATRSQEQCYWQSQRTSGGQTSRMNTPDALARHCAPFLISAP